MVKIIHTADLHLGFRQYGFPQRELDFYTIATAIFNAAITEKCDAILLSGDNFDAAKPQATAVLVLQQLTQMAKDAGIRVLAIDGNHDDCGGQWLEICGVEHIGQKVVVIADKSGGPGMTIGGIDACRPAQFYERITAFKDAGTHIDVLAIHQAVYEMSGFSQDFSAAQIATAVTGLGVQYVAMGDIHTYAETVFNGVRFAYPGAPETNSTDECGNKSCNLVMLENGKLVTGIISLQPRQFLNISITSEEDLVSLTTTLNTASGGPAGVKPVVVAWWNNTNGRDFGKRAEQVLSDSGCMYRLMPFGGGSDIKQKTFAREGAVGGLRNAVSTYFDEGSEEYELVFRLLGSPNSVVDIAQKFITEKAEKGSKA